MRLLFICLLINIFSPNASGAPYGNAYDAVENIRTAFFGTWGYIPIKDIAINHMPGVPEIILFASKFGRFLYSENNSLLKTFIQNNVSAVFISLQVFLCYTSIRFLCCKKVAVICSLLLIIYTSFHVYYFLPLSETIIPFFMMLWGSLYIYTNNNQLSKKDFNLNIYYLFMILMLILWLGLTSPFSVFLLGTVTIFLNSGKVFPQFIENIKICSICTFIFLLILNFRYGLDNIYKWNVIANTDKINLYSLINNIKRHLITNLHGNIFDNQLIPIFIIFSCLLIYFYSKKKGYFFQSKYNFKSFSDYKIYCKNYFLIRIPSFAFLVFSCQVLDGWRIGESQTFADSYLYKTEASWGLVIPLLIIFIRSLSNLFSLSIVRETSFSQKTIRKYFFIHITIGYCLFAFFIGNLSSIAIQKIEIKTAFEGIPKLKTKKEYLKGDGKCGVSDEWNTGLWLKKDMQPCLGVFVNSIPGLTEKEPFKSDFLELIKSKKLVLRAREAFFDKEAIWPVYIRQYADYLSCKKIDDNYFNMKCE